MSRRDHAIQKRRQRGSAPLWLTIWREGGYFWLGHDADVAPGISAFVAPRS
jgi:hypothetical protein